MKTKLTLVPIHQDGKIADIGVDISVQCLACKHLGKPLTCKAFPKGIPKNILDGKVDHSEPIEDQDNDIVFEKRERRNEMPLYCGGPD